MTAPQFEDLKRRVIAGEIIPSEEIAQLTEAQSEEYVLLVREKGWHFPPDVSAKGLYSIKPGQEPR